MKKLVMFVLLALIGGTQLEAKDVFVYNGMTAVQSVKDVRKITFVTGVMNLTQEDGTVCSVNLTDFNNFSFRNKYPFTLGDINNDGTINATDLTLMVTKIMNDDTTVDNTFQAADMNKDGVLNATDLTILVDVIMTYNP